MQLGLEWQIKSPNAQFNWKTSGYSTNKLYVTYKQPITSLRQETLYDLACKTNAGVTQQTQVAMNSYNRFTGLNVKRLSDDKTMTYWLPDANGNYQMGATDTADLLASSDGNGNCQAWSGLLRDVLELNGIGSAKRVHVYHLQSFASYVTVLVNHWNFATTPINITTNPNGYPYTLGVDVVPGTILPGQGNPNTPPHFNGHWITRWCDTTDHRFHYFDPSYGTSVVSDPVGFKALKKYEDGAFAGFSLDNIASPSTPIFPTKVNDTSSGSDSEVDETEN
jgi:hypothetical protein